MTEKQDAQAEKPEKRNLAKRWTDKLAEGKFTPIPEIFLETYGTDDYSIPSKKLTSAEAMLMIHLLSHKWDAEHPYPSFGLLGRKMGISATAVRNHARSLEKKGYMKRIKRIGSSNQFDLSPMFTLLEQRLDEKEARPKRKRKVAEKSA